MTADELTKLGEPCAEVLAEAERLRAALGAQREVNHGLVRTLQAYHAEVERLRAACQALIRAGWEDGRYLAICQQAEWAAAVSLARRSPPPA